MFKSFLLFFTLVYSLYAHPHTFIDIYLKINNKDNIITTINLEWKFDAMTSQLLAMEFDSNMDGKIDKKESNYINMNYFQPLEDYRFYTDIKIQDKSIVTKVKNFFAFIDSEQRIIYRFDIEINTPKDQVYIDFYDEDGFTAFMLKKEFITSDIFFKLVDVDNDFYFAYRLQFKD